MLLRPNVCVVYGRDYRTNYRLPRVKHQYFTDKPETKGCLSSLFEYCGFRFNNMISERVYRFKDVTSIDDVVYQCFPKGRAVKTRFFFLFQQILSCENKTCVHVTLNIEMFNSKSQRVQF